MGEKQIKDKKLLYHLTRLSNLDSILENGLISRQLIKKNEKTFSDIADPQIINKRVNLGLEEYTPFHFHPNTSFDVAVKNTYINDEFIYICITRELAKFNKFKILTKHPLHFDKDYKLYEYDEGFETIDWDAMHTLGTEDIYIKNVKMAECLTELVIQAEHFQSIYVKNEETRILVEGKLRERNLINKPPYVNIGPWL